MISFLIFAIISLVASEEEGGGDKLVANVPGYGKLLGVQGTTIPLSGVSREYLQFLDVPYASVPKRFSPSELLENLPGNGEVYNATQARIYCPQSPLSTPGLIMTEDCLVLQVYTHKLYDGTNDNLRPVILFVHGGSFLSGRGSEYAGVRLLNRDVVLVSVNYRLGIPGFFSLENEDVPGNAGLYDVVNALKWVKQHIIYFGGDPNLVTLAGHSAGSILVTQLTTSPLAQGLFHRVITASGSTLSGRGVTDGTPLDISKEFARRAGCIKGKNNKIAECMRNVNVSTLISIQLQYIDEDKRKNHIGLGIIYPRPQTFSASLNFPKVLPELPRNVMERGEQSAVPSLMSACVTEGTAFFVPYYLLNIFGKGLARNETYIRNEMIPLILSAYGIPKDPSGVRDSMTQGYFGDSQYSGNLTEMYPGLVNLFSVLQVKAGSYENAVLQANVAPTYWASFEYEGSLSFWQYATSAPAYGMLRQLPEIENQVTHNDDMIYLFRITPNTFTQQDDEVSGRMLNYWADFARNGKPSETWPELIPGGDESYVIINQESSVTSHYEGTWAQ